MNIAFNANHVVFLLQAAGWTLVLSLIAFVGGAIGGLGSLAGAALGGFTLGFLVNGVQASLPEDLSAYALMFVFLGVIAILVVAPNGLLELIQKARARARSPVPPRAAEPPRETA